MNPPNIKRFIRRHRSLFWYIPRSSVEDITIEALVETVLNYGTLADVQELFLLIGIRKAAEVFHAHVARQRCDYLPKVKNYFSLYFRHHAQGSSHSVAN